MDDTTFSSSDFYLACFLEIKLNRICVTKRIKTRSYIFVFESNDKNEEKQKEYCSNIKKLVINYINNGNIPALEFKNKIKDLKSRIILLDDMQIDG